MRSVQYLWGPIALTLALGGTAAWAVEAAAPAPPFAVPSVAYGSAQDSAYDKLLAKFDAAVVKHERAIDNVNSLKEKQKLEAKHPAASLWRKFDALGRKGEGRAVVWQFVYADRAGMDAKKVAKARDKAFKALAKSYVAEPWFGEALEAIHAQRESVGDDVLQGLYEAVYEANETHVVKAEALYRLAWIDKRAGRKADSDRRFEELANNYRKTIYGTRAAATRTTDDEVQDGATAPDFMGETLEGHQVALSDYRGKVVLLDFYGFW